MNVNDLVFGECKKEPIKAYESKQGFVEVPVLRGFSSIKPLYELVADQGYICGGYVRYCCSSNKSPAVAGDVDVYLKTVEAFDTLRTRLSTHLVEHVVTDLAITYKKAEGGVFAKVPTVQLIKPWQGERIRTVGTLQDILENFDFTVVRTALLGETTALADADFLHDEEHGILRIKNIHCPISSVTRCMKYSRKGYYIRPTQILQLFLDWERRPTEYRAQVVELFTKSSLGEASQAEVEQLERLIRIVD